MMDNVECDLDWFNELYTFSEELDEEINIPVPKLRPTKLEELLNVRDTVEQRLIPTKPEVVAWNVSTTLLVHYPKVIMIDPKNADQHFINQLILKHCIICSDLNETSVSQASFHLSIALLYMGCEKNSIIKYFNVAGYSPDFVTPAEFDDVLNTYMTEADVSIFNEMLALENISTLVQVFYGVHLCMLGKSLNGINAIPWASRCLRAMCGAGGVEYENKFYSTIYPSITSYHAFRKFVSTTTELRKGLLVRIINILEIPQMTGPIKSIMNAILMRLRFSEMLAFKLVDMYIVNSNFFLFLWGTFSLKIDSVIDVYQLLDTYAEYAPYIKLLTNAQDTPQLNNYDFKVVAEYARLIGIIVGNTTLEKVKFGVTLKNQSSVVEHLTNIINASCNSTYSWTVAPTNKIVNPKLNKNLFKTFQTDGITKKSKSKKRNQIRLSA